MARRIVAVLVLVVVSLAFVEVFVPAAAHARLLIRDAENETCPVTGAVIGRRRFNTTYGSRRYWFSSYDAVVRFKTDPERYMAEKARRKEAATRRR